MLVLVAGIALGLLVLNLKATAVIAGDADSSRRQKVLQLLLVWLLPLVGSLLALGVHRAPEAPTRRYRVQPDPGEDLAMSGRHWKSVSEAADGD